MTSMLEEGESRTEISVRCQHAVNGREGHQKYNVLCTDQWGIHDRFETKKNRHISCIGIWTICMEGQSHKSCLRMDANRDKKILDLMKYS